MTRVFVGIGSNVGDRQAHIERARQGLAGLAQTQVVRISDVYETEPVGPVPQGPFLNAVAEVTTGLDPFDLLDGLASIEQEAGRTPVERRQKWGPRTLDLDILLFGDRVLSSDELVVPHPMMHERWFVLKPLCDLDAGVVHPVLEMTVGELLAHVENGRHIGKAGHDG